MCSTEESKLSPEKSKLSIIQNGKINKDKLKEVSSRKNDRFLLFCIRKFF